MLLGIDVSDSVNEGVSIGKSFAKGFSEGFDLSAVTSKFTGVLGNMVKSAGKLLPGGESADMSSLFSAFFLSKLAKPVLSVGRGAFDIGRAVMGQETRSAVSSLAGRAIGSFSLDAELAGEEILLGEDEYFVLGDNRNNSEDSRYANIGNVKKQHIIGKAWFITSPYEDFGFIKD